MEQNEMDAGYWKKTLMLEPHPEGGHYRETYRSSLLVSTNGQSLDKAALTSIYYLLEADEFSGFHRLLSDEAWYFHKGQPLLIYIIAPNGVLQIAELSDKCTGALFVTVKAGHWFSARLQEQKSFVLVSCAVAPGFEFAEFEMANKNDLIELFPQHTTLLEEMCLP